MSANSYRPFGRIAIAVCVVFLPFLASAQSVDYGGYRPHYQGYGVNTSGGRGGAVCRVTSPNDQAWPPAPGTLRYCVEVVSGPRFVIFETSGTVHLVYGELIIRSPYITIAGQTAPSPGIVVRGQGIVVDTHDVVIQHIRVRVGNVPFEPHTLWIRDNAYNVVADHVSLSWSVWNSVSIFPSGGSGPRDVTILDSVVSESLACSGVNSAVPCDPSSYPGSGFSNSRAMLIRKARGVSLLRNVFAHNNDRQPEAGGSTETILVNNLIYNPSQAPMSSIFFGDPLGEGATFSVVKGNVLVAGPTTPGYNGYRAAEYPEEGDVYLVKADMSLDPGSSIYLDGNYYDKHCGGTACLASPQAQWRLAHDWAGPSVHASAPPLSVDNLPLSSALPYTQVEGYVTANAGARPLDRDAVDERIAYEIASRTGSVPNRPSEKAGAGTGGDGFPILQVNQRPLSVPSNPHGVVDSAGRTRIEAWLEAYARELEPALQGAEPPSDSRTPAAPGSPRLVF